MKKTINPSKLLPAAKSTAIARIAKPKSTNILAKTSPLYRGSLVTRQSGSLVTRQSKDSKDILDANNKLIKIDKFLKSDLIVSQKKAEVKRKSKEKQDFDEAEKKLETPKFKGIKLPTISAPSLGFFDRVKRFLFFTALGWALPKILEFLPKLEGFVKIIGNVYQFAEGLFGKLFDGFMSLVKFGGDLKDKTIGFIASAKAGIGGNYQKEFDKLEKIFNTFVNASIIAGLVGLDMGLAGLDEFKKQRKRQKPAVKPLKPGQSSKPPRGKVPVTTGTGGQKPTGKAPVTTGRGGKVPSWWNRIFKGPFAKLKGPLSRFAGAAVPGLGAVVGAADAAARFKAGDKIGGTLASISATLDTLTAGSAILAMTGFGAVVPAAFGLVSMGIDVVLLVRDIIKAFFPFIPMFSGGGRIVRKYQGGGTATRGGKPVGAPRRRVITPTRKKPIKVQPPKSQPGKDVGGEKKIKEFYSKKIGPDDPDYYRARPLSEIFSSSWGPTENWKLNEKPYKALTTTAKILKDLPFGLGHLMGGAVDLALGQSLDIKKAVGQFSSGISYLVEGLVNQRTNQSITSLMKDISTFAVGGNVPPSREIKGTYSSMSSGDLIAKVLEPTMQQKVNEVIQSIEKQLQIQTGGAGERTPTDQQQSPFSDDVPGARLRDGSNSQIEADLLEYFTAVYGKNAAIGIVANLRRESGYRTSTPDNSSFEGMAQWDRTHRWPAFVRWAESKGLDPYSRNAQAQYITVELKQLGSDARLKEAKTPEEAASIFYNEFERAAYSRPVVGSRNYDPNNPHERKNKAFVQDISRSNPDIGKRTNEVLIPTTTSPVSGVPQGQSKVSQDIAEFRRFRTQFGASSNRNPTYDPNYYQIREMGTYGSGNYQISPLADDTNYEINVHRGAEHWENRAFDIPVPDRSRQGDAVANYWRSKGYTVIWKDGGSHDNHVHVEVPKDKASEWFKINRTATVQPPTQQRPGQQPSGRLTLEQARELEVRASNLKPGDKPIVVTGIGSIQMGKDLLGRPKKKYFNKDGREISQQEFNDLMVKYKLPPGSSAGPRSATRIEPEKTGVISYNGQTYFKKGSKYYEELPGRGVFEIPKQIYDLVPRRQGGGVIPSKPNRPIPNSFAPYETYGRGMMVAIQPMIIEKPVPVSGGNKMIAFPIPVSVNSNIDNAFIGG